MGRDRIEIKLADEDCVLVGVLREGVVRPRGCNTNGVSQSESRNARLFVTPDHLRGQLPVGHGFRCCIR